MTKQTQEAYIVAAVRTPVGKAPRGMFKNVRPDDMLVHVLRAVMKQCEGLDPKAIDDVIVGCAMPEAEQGINVARVGLLLAGLPDNVAGMTINRFCASGLQSVALAADRIRLGEADVMIAGGTESMSMVPMMGNKVSMNPMMFEHEENVAIAYGMGMTAEKVAEQWKVSREDQDEFALTSHQRAIKAIQSGEFQQEIAPYPVDEKRPDLVTHHVREKVVIKDTDEGPRADTSLDALAKLKPVFAAKGSVTAGNSSQMSDGAGAVVLMSEAAMQRFNLSPIGRFIGFSVAGVPPEIMGIGPIKAIPKVLAQTGIKQDDLDWIELNEAFAAQSLAVIRDLGLDRNKVNPLGGAIALGHPLGATGSIRVATLLHGLRRHKQKYGMVTMCIGSGMGAAGVFEAL
ncbi:acetyl-CoA C-acyltransferase [Nitrosomonas ureae]|uniref:acetyl-CoA C-acyltransferase n=1 Tax=Nitrosomonas ureae TaxID=44577 RepID=A0A0S3AKK9_9PROT|nr:acetyl-CoA C-acyltransferase [Nitrosomonas ureae]ALQ51727.1 acetyl-CoA acetyltransferase [Nitrosomonas ureae]SDU17333.1 acetyl-CoA acyltransferase [Nitrosomonas ureae]SOD19410.1 acetyl-CoA acyltransferase [Nitrosomonas ureae]